jgi:hypothetical protein
MKTPRQVLLSCPGRNICSDILLAGGFGGDGLVVLASNHLYFYKLKEHLV